MQKIHIPRTTKRGAKLQGCWTSYKNTCLTTAIVESKRYKQKQIILRTLLSLQSPAADSTNPSVRMGLNG